MAVQPKAVVLYAQLGSVYYPVACAKDVSITTTADLLELAPRTSSVWREFEYGKMTGTIQGSGISTITPDGNLYTVFDLLGQQLNQLKPLVKVSVEENGVYKVLECRVLVSEMNVAGSASGFGNYTYSMQMTGGLTVNSTPVENTNPQILIHEYVATGGENVVFIPGSSNSSIITVYVDGVALRVVNYPSGYGSGEVQWNAATQSLAFGDSFAVAAYVKVIYVDVQAIESSFALEDGSGNIIEDGSGSEIVTQ